MPYTRDKLLPYPHEDDEPDGPVQIRDLAETLDPLLVGVDQSLAALTIPPAEASVLLLGSQSTTSSQSERVEFNTSEFDTGGMWNASLHQMEITGSTAGTYIITAQVCWATNSVGHRACNLVVSGSRIAAPLMTPALTLATRIGMSKVHRLSAGDTVYVESYQSSGSSLNTTGSTTNNTFLSLARLHP